MKFESGIVRAISDKPEIISGLQGRMEDYSRLTLKTLQLGVASKIISAESGEHFPCFRAEGNSLPKGIRESGVSSQNLFSAAKRLGAWFASDDIKVLCRLLGVVF